MGEIRFGTDGWRGIIAEEVTFDSLRLVARAYARRIRAEAAGPEPPEVLVGHDTRFLGAQFARAAAEVLAAEGLRVSLTSRFAPTPAFSHAVVHRGAAGALVVTASHNPAEYSGVKFKAGFGGSVPIAFTRGVEEEIGRIRAAGREPRAADEAPSANRHPQFPIASFDPVPPWLDRVAEFVDLAAIGRSGVRVVLDVMYGAGQGLLAERLRRAGSIVEELHAEVNPAFGGLHPEPIPRYLGGLVARLREVAAGGPCVGIAFDGDSDRIAVVDERGGIASPHQTLALLLRHLVRNRQGAGAVVRSVNIGRLVDREAAALGLPVVVTPIGFKHIAEAMQGHDALVGGEESGGFALRGHIPERDPALIALLLLECLAMTGRSLGTLLGELERDHGRHCYDRLDLRLATLEARDRVVAGLREAPPAAILGVPLAGAEVLDGVRLDRADGSWVMVRASGTEPLLRIYAEAGTEAEVERLLAWGRERAERG